jgi:sugar phosphate isomerase/epimerase
MYMSWNARCVGLAIDPIESIGLAAAAGFDAIDAPIRDIVDSGIDLDRFRKLMDESGIKGGAFPMPVDWRGEDEVFRSSLKAFPRYAAAAKRLGHVGAGTWVEPETRPRESRFQAIDRQIQRLVAIARILADFDLRLGLEVIGVASFRSGRGEPLICKLADLDEILAPIRSSCPRVGIVADVFHLYAADEPLETCLKWGVEAIVTTHVADLPPRNRDEPIGTDFDRSLIVDSIRGLPGENGSIDARSFLQILAEAGYEGPVIAEPLAQRRLIGGIDPIDVARNVRRSLAAVWPRSS